MPPAEDTFIGTSQRRRRLHALVGRDAVEGMFVAAAPASELVLRPPTKFDGRMPPDQFITFFFERFGLGLRDHVLRALGLFFLLLLA